MLHGGKQGFDIGHMDKPVEIYLRSKVDNDYAFSEQDTLVSTEWAQEVPVTRKMMEDIGAGKESSMQEVRWIIRSETNVTTRHWLKYNNLEYDIISVLSMNRDYQLLVTELRPDTQR